MSENLASKTLLIVDDEEILRDAIAFDFKRRGFNVFTAEDGLQALEVISRQKIDAVLTDVRMPRRNGVELLDEVRSKNFRIPVIIFITGFADLTTEDAYDKGAAAVLSKPFDRKTLIQTVARAIEPIEQRFKHPPTEVLSNPKTISSWERLSFGHSGFSGLAAGETPSLETQIRFEIPASQERPELKGLGIVRWIHRSPSDTTRIAMGVEILGLDSACLQAGIAFLDSLKTKSFIPKGL